MADESHVVKAVDWRALFPFTLIFRSFRVAVHPSKLILALLAIFLIYAGGRALDWIWPEKYQAIPSVTGDVTEIDLYTNSGYPASLSSGKIWPDLYSGLGALGNTSAGFTQSLSDLEKTRQEQLTAYRARYSWLKPDADYGDLKAAIKATRDNRITVAEKRYNDAPNKTEQDRHVLEEAKFAARVDANREWQGVRALMKRGLFDTFIDHQLSATDEVVSSVRAGEWIQTSGVTAKLRRFLSDGPVWAVRKHPVFFSICSLYMLAVWAVFGGAIARIAAVHVARDEKISIRQALRFSTSKFLSFFSAPLIPLIIVLAIAVVMAVFGMVSLIPFVGPIAVGVGFILFLLGGFLITLVFFGWIGGSGLMYPTIAVEGSDSFDAISRSFSYLYARPWKLAFYTAVALLYGSICYIFVRFFIYILLRVTERSSGAWAYARETATGLSAFNVMLPAQRGTQYLSFWPNFFDLGPGQAIGAFFIWLWVSLVVAMLGAFAISFYFSAGTIIYMLLRNDVDATELDDVYIDQPDEEFMETAPTVPTASATPGTTTADPIVGQPADVAPPPPPASSDAPVDNPPAQPQ